jgi:membrane protein DedA with SNARE-associated domain
MIGTLAQYTGLFWGVLLSWAGVPMIGTATLGAAGLAASQGLLNPVIVIVVATIAGEIGGLIGYAAGFRWGRRFFARPGKHQGRRERILADGERAYAKWGRLAVFVTPAIVSGTAGMRLRQFVVWNFIASFLYAVSVTLSAYGIGRVLSGHYTYRDIGALIIGLAVTALIVYGVRRRHERRKAAVAAGADADAEAEA